MNELQLTCQDERRRQEVRAQHLNGLDYLEVSADQLTLTVHFLGKAPEHIGPVNVRIAGGRRLRDIRVVDLQVRRQEDPEQDDCMEVQLDKYGDSSTYTLHLVNGPTEPYHKLLKSFDPRYAQLAFTFKEGCPSDLDCKTETVCPPADRAEPEINYLAKDYASFRQLILDRLALIMPDWQERHVPDLGITLVELLAYVGDYLSYYQDAVATEAYLDTSRQRISVRRHARLVDYTLHEGCNARAWVCVDTDNSNVRLDPKDTFFITADDNALPVSGNVLEADDLQNVPAGNYEVFEPMAEHTIQLVAAHNEIHFYTWGNRECCLPRGATTATLRDEWEEDAGGDVVPHGQQKPYAAGAAGPHDAPHGVQEQQGAQQEEPPAEPRQRRLHLKPGDVLIFEEVRGPKTGVAADADPAHRQAVRLTRVQPDVDELYHQPVIDVEWAAGDALRFPLCLSAIGPPPDCAYLDDISVARGNVILVDHGQTIKRPDDLKSVLIGETTAQCAGEGRPADTIGWARPFRPHLESRPLTFREPLAAHAAASRALKQDPRQALPQIKELTGTRQTPNGLAVTNWTARRDLLGSRSDDYHFAVEMDNAGLAHLRFGDGELGRMPEAETSFQAVYRIGSGPAGNVGAEAISRIVFRKNKLSGGIQRVRNPLPALGGTAPEPLAEAKLFAPRAFRNELQRAITADDYAQLVQRDFQNKVQRAVATLRWTGSWYEVLVAVDPFGGEEADAALLKQIATHLVRYRRIGHDVVVRQARHVALEIAMTVCVLPHYLRGHVEAALLDVFSNRVLPDGRLGFFHPDNLTFGEGIFLSKLVAAAQAVTGVETVHVTTLERLYEGPNQELQTGLLPLGPLEVARLDNDPSFPENGKLSLDLRGGR